MSHSSSSLIENAAAGRPVQPFAETPQTQTIRKEWITVAEATTYSSLTKPHIYQLMDRGLFRYVSLRERGKVKGKRLISFDSLRAFLESRAKGGEPTAA